MTTSVFALGRMRHLDLLALWHRLNPGSPSGDLMGALSKEALVTAIIASPA